jgi:hypothetical protein
MITNTVKRTGDIYIKPEYSNTRTTVMKSNLNVVTQTTIKLKVLIYNVDREHTAEELIYDLIHQNSELRDTSNDQNTTPSLKDHL